MRAEKTQAEATLSELDNEKIVRPKPLTGEAILKLYPRLEQVFQSQDNAWKRKMLRYFIRRLELDPEGDALTIYFFAEPAVASVSQSHGARDRT